MNGWVDGQMNGVRFITPTFKTEPSGLMYASPRAIGCVHSSVRVSRGRHRRVEGYQPLSPPPNPSPSRGSPLTVNPPMIFIKIASFADVFVITGSLVSHVKSVSWLATEKTGKYRGARAERFLDAFLRRHYSNDYPGTFEVMGFFFRRPENIFLGDAKFI